MASDEEFLTGDEADESTSLISNARSRRRRRHELAKNKYDAVKFIDVQPEIPRFYINRSHVILSILLISLIIASVAFTLADGLPKLDEKWSIYYKNHPEVMPQDYDYS